MSRGKKNELSGEALRVVLEDACRGLIFISETDAEIEPVLAEGERPLPMEEFVKERASSGKIETRPAEEFFERLTKDREWHRDVERERVRRFRRLKKILLDNLEDMSMFRVGRIRIKIFVLGHDADGNIAGIRTVSVET